MTETFNYRLQKPEANDYYDIEIFNKNMDIVDEKLNEIEKNSSGGEIIQAHIENKNNPHTVTKEQVGLGNVPNVATNEQTPTYTIASSNENLSSGERLEVAFGKIAKAISSLISHLTDNTLHITTAERNTWNAKVDSTGTVANATNAVNADTLDGLHANSFIQTSQSVKVIVSTTAPADTTAVWIVPN